MEQIIIPEYMKPIVQSYYVNNAKRLCSMVDKILFKLKFVGLDKNDFYSLANEVFMYAVRDYDSSKSFDGFLYSCLYKKFCTEMTSRRRDKRCTKIKVKEKNEKGEIEEKIIIIPDESLDAPIDNDNHFTLGEIIAGDHTVEKEIFENDEECYSRKMLLYLSKLSSSQKEVLRLNIAGYLPNEIKKELNMSEKEYADCYAAIHSYRNVSVLF